MVLKEVIAYYSTQASLYCTMLDATKHNVGNKAEWVLSGKFQTRPSPLRGCAKWHRRSPWPIATDPIPIQHYGKNCYSTFLTTPVYWMGHAYRKKQSILLIWRHKIFRLLTISALLSCTAEIICPRCGHLSTNSITLSPIVNWGGADKRRDCFTREVI